MKNIRKRKDGRYEYRKMINGKTYQCISHEKERVKKFATAINKKIKNSFSNTEEEKNITFYQYAINYYKVFKENKLGEKTKFEYNNAHKIFKENFNKPFKNLTAETFQTYLNKLEIEHPTLSLKIYNKICAICKHAFIEGIIKNNIAEIIVKPNAQYNTRRALNLKEQQELLKILQTKSNDLRTFCLFCIITSARREEAISLRKEHFDETNMTLFINGTKTLNAPRTIRITQEFANLLKKINFTFQHKGNYYTEELKAIFKQIGSNDLTLNCLRHTCATNMVYLGVPPDYRKHIMGHSTILTTDKVYTHIDTKIKKSDIENLYKGLYFTDFNS